MEIKVTAAPMALPEYKIPENYTTDEELKTMYNHPWAITKDRLPELY